MYCMQFYCGGSLEANIAEDSETVESKRQHLLTFKGLFD